MNNPLITAGNLKLWSRLGPSGAFGAAACELAKHDDRIVMLTADLSVFTGLERFRRNYPDQFFNIGIAEQNLVGIASGMSSEGLIPFATTYASFAVTRALDQVKVSMGYMGLPVKLVGFVSGFASGILGATHLCLEDIAVIRAIPKITILSPADCLETVKAVQAASIYEGPVYIRLSGGIPTTMIYRENYNFEIGKSIELRSGSDLKIIATGAVVAEALKAAELLEQQGIKAGVINMHTIKPLDKTCLQNVVANSSLLVTLEEHSILGGLGEAVASYLVSSGSHPPLLQIGAEGDYPHAASYTYLIKQAGMDAQSVAQRILMKLEEL